MNKFYKKTKDKIKNYNIFYILLKTIRDYIFYFINCTKFELCLQSTQNKSGHAFDQFFGKGNFSKTKYIFRQSSSREFLE